MCELFTPFSDEGAPAYACRKACAWTYENHTGRENARLENMVLIKCGSIFASDVPPPHRLWIWQLNISLQGSPLDILQTRSGYFALIWEGNCTKSSCSCKSTLVGNKHNPCVACWREVTTFICTRYQQDDFPCGISGHHISCFTLASKICLILHKPCFNRTKIRLTRSIGDFS